MLTSPDKGGPLMLDDLRKTIEATIGELTPARARSLAKSLAGPGAAKDQVAKSAGDLIEWSQKNRERLKGFVQREVSSQLGVVGAATQADLDSLRKRVRTLERASQKQKPASPRSAVTQTADRRKAEAATVAPSTTKAKKATKQKITRASDGRAPAKGTGGDARARG